MPRELCLFSEESGRSAQAIHVETSRREATGEAVQSTVKASFSLETVAQKMHAPTTCVLESAGTRGQGETCDGRSGRGARGSQRTVVEENHKSEDPGEELAREGVLDALGHEVGKCLDEAKVGLERQGRERGRWRGEGERLEKPPERCPAPTIICIRKTKTKMAEYPSMAVLRAVSKKPRKPAHALPSCCDGGDRR